MFQTTNQLQDQPWSAAQPLVQSPWSCTKHCTWAVAAERDGLQLQGSNDLCIGKYLLVLVDGLYTQLEKNQSSCSTVMAAMALNSCTWNYNSYN